MTPIVLGLDIGGANLKAATVDKRAVSVPFALWKQPDRLPAALADLVGQFPDATELAVTMTGELCDCYETKRQGVNAILDAVESVAKGRRIGVWSTSGKFLSVEESRRNRMHVAAANWHALATYAGRYAPYQGALLLDIGSTTTDIIPLDHGVPSTYGTTDLGRLQMRELVYIGVRRTPLFAVYTDRVCAELFSTTQDVFVVLGLLPEDPSDTETANGRPLTREHCLTRLARTLGADREELTDDRLVEFAKRVRQRVLDSLSQAARRAYYDVKKPPELRTVIVSGAGEFLAREVSHAVLEGASIESVISLNDILGSTVSACAPAYALAVLGTEHKSGRVGQEFAKSHQRLQGLVRLRKNSSRPTRAPMLVVKVGGSLYDHPRFAYGLQAYLSALAEPVFLVPGGGDFADVVRKLDALHNLNKEASHSLALQSMNLAGDFLKRLGITATILDANSITALPHSWNVTSDSIAAQATIAHNASRLILLKSIDIPPGTSWSKAAAQGWVDPHFPQLATNAPFTIEVINFRKYLDSLDERG